MRLHIKPPIFMIFASDLDRTLIYSKRSFLLGNDRLPPVRLIETIGEKEISFMTEKAISILEQLVWQLTFVPVTTRTIEQYQRITLFQKELVPQYAVVSNGGIVLLDGKPLPEWTRYVKQRINQHASPFTDILNYLEGPQPDRFLRSSLRLMDQLFYAARIDPNSLPHDELPSFREWLKKEGWDLSIQGRKIYFIPSVVNKWEGVSFVKEQIGAKQVIAAGDSLLDLDMITQANYGIAPSHGEIYELLHQELTIPFTQQKGLLASEEILQFVATTAAADLGKTTEELSNL